MIGPILCIYFMTQQVKPNFPPKAQRFHMGEITLGENCAGRTLDDLAKDLPAGRPGDDGPQGAEQCRSVGRYRSGAAVMVC